MSDFAEMPKTGFCVAKVVKTFDGITFTTDVAQIEPRALAAQTVFAWEIVSRLAPAAQYIA